MSKQSKIIYGTAAAIIIVAVTIAVAAKFGSNSQNTSSQNQVSQNQDSGQNQASQSQNNQAQQSATQTAQKLTPVPGCPTGPNDPASVAAVNPSATFKPTINISNKVVTLNTNFGIIKLEMYDKDAPRTVENFVCLAKEGYYNGVTFHRVAHNFVIQGGDPTGTGMGGQSIYGEEFADELNPNTASYKTGYVKGVLAMANHGPNTNGSQFFICLNDLNNNLGKNYTIFGKVIEGQDVVDKIGALPVQGGGDDGHPAQQVIINSATVN